MDKSKLWGGIIILLLSLSFAALLYFKTKQGLYGLKPVPQWMRQEEE